MIALWLIIDEIHIGTLATHPRYRRRGIARRLLSTALRFALQQGVRTATLEVRHSNVAAQALYSQFGFTVAGRRRAYYHDNNEDALLMTALDLDPSRLAREGDVLQPFETPERSQALPEGRPPGGEA
jgi:ribosomal-protein-alanine N-acetyltransferase